MDTNKNCNHCMNKRAEKCFGGKEPCELFKFTGIISDEEKSSWPEHGDATHIRTTGRNRNS